MDQRNCEVLTMDIEWPYACVCTYTYTCSGLRFEVLILSYVAKTIMGLIPSEFGQGITRFIIDILLCYVNFNDGLKRKFWYSKILVKSSFIKLWAISFLYLIETSRIEWNSSIFVSQLACSFSFFLSKLIINKYVS